MAGAEKITGKRKVDILEALKNDRALIRVRLPGKDYQTLTTIEDIREKGGHTLLLIGCTEALKQHLADDEAWTVQIEFTGKDGLWHNFDALGEKVFMDAMWVTAPEFIERKQRREYFRLKAPSGVNFSFEDGSGKKTYQIMDISIGGAVVIPGKGVEADPGLSVRQTLNNAEVMFPQGLGKKTIRIQTCIIVRRDQDPVTGKTLYGIQFTRIEPDSHRTLKDVIYRLQRQFLRQRLPLRE